MRVSAVCIDSLPICLYIQLQLLSDFLKGIQFIADEILVSCSVDQRFKVWKSNEDVSKVHRIVDSDKTLDINRRFRGT